MTIAGAALLGRTAGASRVTPPQGRCPQYSWCRSSGLRAFSEGSPYPFNCLLCDCRLRQHCAGTLHGCAYAPLRPLSTPRDTTLRTCCARTPQLLLTELPKPSCLQPRTSSLATSAPRYSRGAYGRSCLLRRRALTTWRAPCSAGEGCPKGRTRDCQHAESSTGCGGPLYTMYDFVRGKLLAWAYSVPANVERRAAA
ncbi:hypothetical protein FB107DRAFT_255209, partial [Schizophyllum commune]